MSNIFLKISLCLVLFLSIAFHGCATITVRSSNNLISSYYPATHFDVWMIDEIYRNCESWERLIGIPLWAIDVFPSVVSDTILFPFDYITHDKLK